jgi:hypothetical protein
MACFIVPLGEAIVTTIVQKAVEKREKKAGSEKTVNTGLTWDRRLSWLNKMLWGGSVMLVIDHIWNGEIILRPPFLTAMENPSNIAPMLKEITTLGVAMAACVTVVWGIMILVAELKTRAMSRVTTAPVTGSE